jgi:hypothetical protein
MRFKHIAFLVACLGLTFHHAAAEDVYYSLALSELTWTDRPLPEVSVPDEAVADLRHDLRQEKETFMQPYVATDGDAEIYLRAMEGNGNPWSVRSSLAANVANTRMVIRASGDKTVRGTLFLPKADWSGMQAYSFQTGKSADDQRDARADFLAARETTYRNWQERNIPGAAWFRYQALQTRGDRDVNDTGDANQNNRRRNRESELQRTFALFSGGRALSENLQLDRELALTSQAESHVPLDSLEGITVTEIDWQPIIKDLSPQKDPLAQVLPADQHALIFPSFTAMAQLIDEAKAHGTPILQLVDPRSEDALTHERYEKQLCLSLDTWARLLGPTLIQSVAMTGSDPYLRTGSDIAILFETSDTAKLKTAILLQYQLAQSLDPRAQSVSGSLLGHPYQGVVKPDRSVCSYLAAWDGGVLVTNSLAQLKKVLQAKTGAAQNLQDLDEYTFFRDRYKCGEPESALLIITDATIRRWCGPRWRIGASRRVRAGAFMAQLQAARLETLVAGFPEDQRHLDVTAPIDMGTLALTPQGVTSTRYGSLAFATPIAELAFTEVTHAEAEAYRRYRDRYQRRWQQFFDPIAIRFNVQPNSENRIAMDLTVRPLIASTEYRRYLEIAGNRGIRPQAGDPHKEALGQFVLSIDRNAPSIQQFGGMAAAMAPGLKANPLGWLGDWLAVYVDEDAFWQDYQAVSAQGKRRALDEFMENNLSRLPVALHVDVSHSLKLAGFLVAVRTFVEQTVPNMTRWDNLSYQDQAYVRVRPAEQMRSRSNVMSDLALYYVVTPQSLVVSLSEPMIRRAIDRQKPPETGTPADVHAWQGESMAVHVKGSGMALVQALFDHNAMSMLRQRSWGNLVILNEWQRHFGDTSPVALHQRLWQTKLVCPGGGDYVWNETFQTMESTVFGCPAQPKAPAHLPNALTSLKDVNMGLTFEEDGLRARAEVKR